MSIASVVIASSSSSHLGVDSGAAAAGARAGARPAHTLFELCTVDAGLRPGVGLYLGLSSIVGRTAGFRPIELGAASLGTDRVLGRPGAGTRPGGSRAGVDAQVG